MMHNQHGPLAGLQRGAGVGRRGGRRKGVVQLPRGGVLGVGVDKIDIEIVIHKRQRKSEWGRVKNSITTRSCIFNVLGNSINPFSY